jgi:hypothetical protein
VRRRRWGRSAALLAVIGALGLSACVPVKGPAEPPVITTTPALIPGFQRNIVDYVNRCDPNTPTNVQVDAGEGTTVSVNGSPPAGGTYVVQVNQDVGKQFTVDVTTNGATTTYHIRCLPTDFPQWTTEKTGTPDAAFYTTVLIEGFGFGDPSYPIVFDTNGVPVWWLDRKSTFVFQPFANKNFATMKPGGGLEEYNLNGGLVRSLSTVGTFADFHDVELLSNGNYVMATEQRQPCDLSAWGLVGLKTCINHVFQELTPQGVPVFTWDTSLHVPVTETPPHWRNQLLSGEYDPFHYNSVEDTGDGFIISFRHLDAVYRIDKTNALGPIVWKLGGTTRTESLTVSGDPNFGTNGQHDARLLGDGTVTIYDNGTQGTNPARQPRFVRYSINVSSKTATLVEQLQDADVTQSGCCGSARRLPGGHWVTGWGFNNTFSEYTSTGTRVFRLVGTFVYRALPILPGEFTAEEFRNGMDARYAG